MIKNSNEVIVLSTADWDNPFWTNKQHVAMDLAKKGYKVFYIDSLGLRRPSVNKKDFKRIIKRCLKGLKPPKRVEGGILVWSPILIPFNDKKIIRKLNKIIFSSMLKFWLMVNGFKKSILWTYNPLTTKFINVDSFEYSVYHCVDEIKAQPGMPVTILEDAEKELTKLSDIVFVTSPTLLETRKAWSDKVYYFSNVADYSHFSKALFDETEIPEDMNSIPEPRLGFIGAISSYKINFNLLYDIAKRNEAWNIVLIGDVGEGDPNTDVSILKQCKNIHFLGAKSYSVLPNYLKGFDIALLPNNLNEYTDNMFPMKFFEYLSAGRNVISVDLLSIRDFQEYVRIGHDNEEFIRLIEDVLNGNKLSIEKIQEIAQQYTYETRTTKMIDVINSQL
ncbi:glycosyltransferase [Klebsiella pneumoniae]|uniref:glycosyltransferase n=1 Tax=Klebsiella pneumoniae TaxID=573 RepID=UPI001E553902|nr:glycosyltransferase [Klebsiella pneumoniae]MCC4986889.1 glycosyltransferase [Klebsiella pneumoniae]MDZ0374073.1 glycosyltransferase [Klebsiella pneumoniae]